MVFTVLLILVVLIAIFLATFIRDSIYRYKNRDTTKKYHKSEVITAYVLLLPAVVLCFLFVILPIFFSLGYAFTDFNRLEPENIDFVGFDNFVKIFKEIGQNKQIVTSITNTAIFVVIVVPLQILLALLLALFCNNKRRGTTIFKICFFAPVAISLVVTSYLWVTILSNNESGIMNSLLKMFGIPAQDFLGERYSALIWMVIISAWQGCGYQMLIFLSALGNIRKDLYEAARVDGANAFQRFITVTVPGLKPTMLYIVITVFIGACRVLIQPMLLTNSVDSTSTISLYIYKTGFNDYLVGYSCAVAFLFTIFIGTITFLQRKFLGEKKKA